MKKLLLISTALAGVAFAAPAQAALKMDIGGYFRGYGVDADNNEFTLDTVTAIDDTDASGLVSAGASRYDQEFRRDSEVHVSGETTLDNGLTIGAHTEFKVADGTTAVTTDEVYAYASGSWGRVNFGTEDGAAYLLQVAAPSADSNVDGMRTYIGTANPSFTIASFGTYDADGDVILGGNGAVLGLSANPTGYAHSDFRQTDRLTYLSPKFNGFQAGASYAPQNDIVAGNTAMALDTNGAAEYNDLWEVSARWDGEFQGFGIAVGGGYSSADLEDAATAADVIGVNSLGADTIGLSDGLTTWNGGASVSYAGFTLGGSYSKSSTENVIGRDIGAAGNTSDATFVDVDQKTWVLGLGYDNGPWHVGGTWLERTVDRAAVGDRVGENAGDTDAGAVEAVDYKTTQYALGAGYTFGPGMSFRGSVVWGDNDNGTYAALDNDFTQVAIGTDIQF